LSINLYSAEVDQEHFQLRPNAVYEAASQSNASG